MIVMHHPELGREAAAVDSLQAGVWKKSGWVEGPLPKVAKRQAADSKQPSEPKGDVTNG